LSGLVSLRLIILPGRRRKWIIAASCCLGGMRWVELSRRSNACRCRELRLINRLRDLTMARLHATKEFRLTHTAAPLLAALWLRLTMDRA
jgi:hypothetical protein